MSVPFQKQVDRIRSLPRPAQVGIVVVALIAGWWICRDTVWAWAGGFSREAEEMRDLLARGRDQTDRRLLSVRDAVIAHGAVQPPRRPADGSAQLAQEATRIIKVNEGVSNFKYEARTATKLPPSALREVIGDRQRAERAIAELQFEASPEIVSRVIADLEASPSIDAISTLRLQRLDGPKKLRVKMIIEAWVVGSETGSRSVS